MLIRARYNRVKTYKFGYARVSSKEQDTQIQQDQLKGLVNEVIFETVSGKSIDNRPELQKLLAKLRSGDEVIVTKLDRLARNTVDALNIADKLKELGVALRFMDLDSVDINSTMGRLVYTVMASIAEMERKRIKERCDDGRAKAKAEGKHLGRNKEINRNKVKLMLKNGLNQTQVAKQLDCSRMTISRIMKEEA